MQELACTAETVVGATAEQVWDAITNPALTARYVFGCAIEGEWRPGGAWRYQAGGSDVIAGSVVEADPPRLLRLTASNVWNPRCHDDPPYRITWRIEPAPGGRSRVILTHDGFPSANASYEDSRDVHSIVDGLRIVVDPEMAAAVRRLDAIGSVEVVPLTPDRAADYLDFFDHRAFADNPAWQFCYCYNFRFGGGDEELSLRTGADNRRDMGAAIRAGRAHGLLAYVDGLAVGWCSASLKAEMPGLAGRAWMTPDAPGLGIVGCLAVAPQYRRHGVGRRLVEAAEGYLAGLGCSTVEAYPLARLDVAAHGHWGPIEVYRDLGYETYREIGPRVVVRKRLA